MVKRAAFTVGVFGVCAAMLVVAVRVAGDDAGKSQPVDLEQLPPGVTSLGPIGVPIDCVLRGHSVRTRLHLDKSCWLR